MEGAMRAISTKTAPAAIGPYSQAVEASGFIFLSGQIPLDPGTGKMIEGDISAQTERVLDNLGAVLKAAGCDFAHIVKTTIYLVDLNDFQLVNDIYGKRFTRNPPARATVQVSALPRGAKVEIDAIASLPQLPG
jgi:2-iminobutanoate/2-iminopropanoate deaminase